MLVEKLLARPFENLDASDARQLLADLDETALALEGARVFAEAQENRGTQVLACFDAWRVRLDERRARVAALYLNRPSCPGTHERPDAPQVP
jgi:hypothetical protein